MSNAWISTKSFTQSASQAIHVAPGSFDRFWDSWWWLFVKGFHFGEFALLFWLFAHSFRRGFGWPIREAIGWALAGSIAFASIDEFHQSFISFRGGRLSDVMIDIGGVAFAMLITLWRNRRDDHADPQEP